MCAHTHSLSGTERERTLPEVSLSLSVSYSLGTSCQDNRDDYIKANLTRVIQSVHCSWRPGLKNFEQFTEGKNEPKWSEKSKIRNAEPLEAREAYEATFWLSLGLWHITLGSFKVSAEGTITSASAVPRRVSNNRVAYAMPPKGGRGWCPSPLPVWDLRAVIWFHFTISCLVLLPSDVTLSVLSFFSAAGPFSFSTPENSSIFFR